MNYYKALLAVDALADLRKAIHWYEQKQKGLGKRLQDDIRKTLRQIKRNPFYEPVQYGNIRIASCQRFPYSLHYEIIEEGNSVLITIIIHQHKKPFWLPDITDTDDS